jgi:hypothetical protein
VPRMQLTDEEARVVLDFRAKNAVRHAHNNAIDSCRALVRGTIELLQNQNRDMLRSSDVLNWLAMCEQKMQQLRTEPNGHVHS